MNRLHALRAGLTAFVLSSCLVSCTSPVFFSAGHSPDAVPGMAGPERKPWGSVETNTGDWPALDPWSGSLGSQGLEPGAPEAAWGERPAISFDSRTRAVQPGSTGAGEFGARAGSEVQTALAPPSAARFGADGGAAAAGTPGSVGMLDAPARSLEAEAGTRPYLLELLQGAHEERDALASENQSLLDELQVLQEKLALATSSPPPDAALAQRAANLQVQVDAKGMEMRDLAARLLQAQVRRLEADQRLIEQWIALEEPEPALGNP